MPAPALSSVRRLFFAVALLAGLAVMAGPASNRADAAPPAWPKTFVIEYFWGWDELPPAGLGPTAALTLNRDGTFSAFDYASGETGTGTWFTRRSGREIVFQFDGTTLAYTGTRVGPGMYEGAMGFGVPGYPEGVWRGTYMP